MKVFKTLDDAKQELNILDNETYILLHSEYARPCYKIKKINGGYAIRIKRFFFIGSYGTNKNGNKFSWYY